MEIHGSGPPPTLSVNSKLPLPSQERNSSLMIRRQKFLNAPSQSESELPEVLSAQPRLVTLHSNPFTSDREGALSPSAQEKHDLPKEDNKGLFSSSEDELDSLGEPPSAIYERQNS